MPTSSFVLTGLAFLLLVHLPGIASTISPCTVISGTSIQINDGETCSISPGFHTGQLDTLKVDGNLIVESSGDSYVQIVAKYVEIGTTGRITADGQGYPKGNGPGAGNSAGSGGGHGGRGGRPSSSYLSAGQSESYGNHIEPVKRGSGGGGSNGGAGGGVLHIVGNFTVEVEGIISANGEDATGSSSGGGAGGSIFIWTDQLSGSGRISAVGGRGGTNGGGGAGGRISIERNNNLFTGQVFAHGGRPDGDTDPYQTASSMSSSSNKYSQTNAEQGRLENGNTNWRPSSNNANHYLDAIYTEPFYLTAIATRGCKGTECYGGNQNTEYWVKTYYLEIDSGSGYQQYKDVDGSTVLFSGNVDGRNEKINYLDFPVLVNKVRINPQSWQSHISMAMGSYGYENEIQSHTPETDCQGHNEAESGGPGTIHTLEGSVHKLIIDNMGNQPKFPVTDECTKYQIADSGAAAWLQAEQVGQYNFNEVTLQNGGHLVLNHETAIFDDIFGEEASILHVASGNIFHFGYNSVSTSTLYIYDNAVLEFAGNSTSFKRSLSAWGELRTDQSHWFTFGGFEDSKMTLYPYADNDFHVNAFTIKEDATVILENSNDPAFCGYSLHIAGGFAELIMEDRSSLKVSCPSSLVGEILQMGVQTSATISVDSPLKFDTFQIGGMLNMTNKAIIEGKLGGTKVLNFIIVDTGAVYLDTEDENMVINGTEHPEVQWSELYFRDAEISGQLHAKSMKNNGDDVLSTGWEILNVLEGGLFNFTSVDKFEVDDITVNGQMIVQNHIWMEGRATNTHRVRSFIIGENGEVRFDEQGRDAGSWSNASRLIAHQVYIHGKFQAGLLSVDTGEMYGWDTLVVDGSSAEFKFEAFGEFSCNDIEVTAGTMEIFNPATIQGKDHPLCNFVRIGSEGSILLDKDGGDREIWRDVPSHLYAEMVIVNGTLHAGGLTAGPGWYNLAVGPVGLFTLQAFTSELSINTVIIAGTVDILNPITIKGRDRPYCVEFTELPGGSITIDSGNYEGSGRTNLTYSTLLADYITLDGDFTALNLSFTTIKLTVGGSMTFDPATPEIADEIVVRDSGLVEVLKPITIRGLTGEKTNAITINGTMKLDTAAGDHTNRQWSAGEASIFHLVNLTVIGEFHGGLLSEDDGWTFLIVDTGAIMTFEPNTTWYIFSAYIAGSVKSYIPFLEEFPLICGTLTIDEGGVFDIDYKGPTVNDILGAPYSTLKVEIQITVDGMLKTGSLHLETPTAVVGNTGQINVDGGGYLSDEGPGAGISSSDNGGSGASYGGRGGRACKSSSECTLANMPYADIFRDTEIEWGSGGGSGSGAGGRGGGRIYFRVQHSFTMDGHISLNAENAAGSNGGGGSGGGLWIRTESFIGTGTIASNGGNGNGYGGGGSGGRINIYYETGDYHSGKVTSKGGSVSNSNAEPGGPGVAYLSGTNPIHRNLRIDNKCQQAHVTRPTGDRATDEHYNEYLSTGAIAYLLPPTDDFIYEFTHVEVYGAAELAIFGNRTVVKSDHIYGDDTGYVSIGPYQYLELTAVSPYKRENVTYAPYIYENATFKLPTATSEFRQSFDWNEVSGAFNPCPASMLVSSQDKIWGTLDGSNAHLLVGTGGTITMQLPATRDLQFVGITIQDGGLFDLKSLEGVEEEQWHVQVVPGSGEGKRYGRVTIEGGGQFVAANLELNAHSLIVDSAGLLSVNNGGVLSGQGTPNALVAGGGGYGGRGGKGQASDTTTGLEYGKRLEPVDFGSGGAGRSSGTNGGIGGGILRLTVQTDLTVEGVISADGNSGTTNTGGGSGGSIWVTTETLEGFGIIRANGGSGGTNGGGGGGGRIGLYWTTMKLWYGQLQAYGGDGSYGIGGAGTVFTEDTEEHITNRSLTIHNNDRSPPTPFIEDYDQYEQDSSRTWLLEYDERHDYEEVHIIKNGHLALHPNFTRPFGLHAFQFIGDRTGWLHIGPDQYAVGQFESHETFEVNIHVHEDGELVLPPTCTCRGVDIIVEGILSVHNFTIGDGCRLLLSPTGRSHLIDDDADTEIEIGNYRFDRLEVENNGEITSMDGLDDTQRKIKFTVGDFHIKGGGHVHTVNLEVNADTLIIDDLGRLVADYHSIPCNVSEGAGKTGTSDYGSSGAGHGGSSGRGSRQRKTGAPFGHLYEPDHFGCTGGGSGGGKGGGKMTINTDWLKIDGEVSANGEAGQSRAAGGGSGGSIRINTRLIQGYGEVEVNGGDGHVHSSYHGGGGAAGRIAVYFSLNRTYSGSFNAHGGLPGGANAGAGGPGTMIFYHNDFDHLSLMVDNNGRGPKEDENMIEDYHDLTEDESRAWILPSSEDHEFSGDNNYHFDELQMYGQAHLAILTDPPDREASFYFQNMIGDRTGTIHVGMNQTVDLFRDEIDVPFNVRVYEGGFLGMANDTFVHGVTIFLDGVLAHVDNLTLHHGGRFWLNRDGRTEGNPSGEYNFDVVHVQDQGYIHMISDPVSDPGMLFTTRLFWIDGGGFVEGTHLYIRSENITVDAGGRLSADGLGYSVSDGSSTEPDGTPRTGLHGVINEGLGFTYSSYGSGGGHGGTGGHGKYVQKTGRAYGHIYEPEHFGSAGGGPNGGTGGGRIWFNVTDTIQIDGTVSANGADGTGHSGGGSGGSIWMHSYHITGYGLISTNGGNGAGYGGGGAGGRTSLHFFENTTFVEFTYESHGGTAGGSSCDECEGGGPGTIFLYHMVHNHRTLMLENAGLVPREKAIDWNSLDEDGCRGWILTDAGSHEFANHNHEYHFEELQIYRGAHLAVLNPNDTFESPLPTVGEPDNYAPRPPPKVTIHFRHMIGDRSGTVHVYNRQEMDLEREKIDLPFSVHVYFDGHLGLAPATVVHGVYIHMAGLLSHVVNMTLHHGGFFWCQHGGRTIGEPFSHYSFQFVRIQDDGYLNATTDPIVDPGITFIVQAFIIEGGGIMHGTRMTILAENITVDAGGKLAADGLGYHPYHNNDTHGDDSLHGDVNIGQPNSDLGVGCGAGHGGSGGRGSHSNGRGGGFAYGDLYEPYVFGSAGGFSHDAKPGGTGGGIIWMNVTDTIDVDGEVTANGGFADQHGGGGGSGGSVWIYANIIKGYGRIAADGGEGSTNPSYAGGGGGGGRVAIYFITNETSTGFSYHTRGGRAGRDDSEHGGGGTAFVYHLIHTHRTLIIDNGGLEPRDEYHKIDNYTDLSHDGCRTWILPQSGHHFFAGGTHDYVFEEVQMYGAAHMAMLTHPVFAPGTMFFLYMIGDRTATVHIGYNQTMDLEIENRHEIDLPFSVRVYHGGFLGLAPETFVHNVSIWLSGVLAHVDFITLHHSGLLALEDGGQTVFVEPNQFEFDRVLIQDTAMVTAFQNPVENPGMNMTTRTITIEGGGTFHVTHMTIVTENITIDDGGALTANGKGYRAEDDMVTLGSNPGKGYTSVYGSSGGGHGGTSGHGAGIPETGNHMEISMNHLTLEALVVEAKVVQEVD
ncbi:uncharacterized protein [Ptychodera flava]|uniref:uncharacterized protein n=1 Tax=Ptychodera flava TaxID=63121 RepID=UPI003969D017